MALEADRQLLHYRLVDKIGEGGMGVVWRAVDTTLDREVAIKVLPQAFSSDPERMARFEREAKTLASVNHPGIAGIHGMHEVDGTPFIAMELVRGEDLSARLARGAVPADEALDIVGQIAAALAAAHEQGIVHRDLKPANVLRTPEGTVKVLDFGLAKMLGGDSGAGGADPAMSPTITSLGTQAGMIMGTAAYMSPEQARGQMVDRRADLWSLGVVLYEMLAGKRLFDGGTVSDTLAAVLRAEVDLDALPDETPANARRILQRCLDRDPKRRLRDAAEVSFLAGEPALSPEGGAAGGAAATTVPRSTAATLALIVLAMVAGAAAGIFLWPGDAPTAAEIVRSTIPPPEGGRYFLSSRQPGPATLSPDGSRVVFVVRDEDRGVSLWVRKLDSDVSVHLDGTDGASYPFWSPDSRHVGFFADREMKRVSLASGAVLSICDAPFGKGGSWNEVGQIVFTPMYNSPIHIVSENGGTSTPLTTFDESTRENSHRFPFFLPDGHHFLYLVRVAHATRLENRIRIATIDGEDLGVLLETPAQAIYRSGRLLYVKDAVLLARPFDPETRTFSGQPIAIASDVDIIEGAARAVFSASNDGKLIYMTEDTGLGHGMTWIDRAGTHLKSMADQGPLYTVAISPDGRSIAADSEDDLWVVDVDRGTRRRVTYSQAMPEYPVWTPDGKSLIYRAQGERYKDIYIKASDGSGEERLLVRSGADKITNDVSPDGRFLVYSESLPESGFDIRIQPLQPEGDEPEPHGFIETPTNEEAATFSPDGRFLAYMSDETGVDEIYIVSFPDKHLRAQISTEGGMYPRWNDDGTELYFLSPRDEIMVAQMSLGLDSIDVGTPEALLFLTNPTYGNYDVHGDRFLVEAEVEGRDRPPLRMVLNWTALGE